MAAATEVDLIRRLRPENRGISGSAQPGHAGVLERAHVSGPTLRSGGNSGDTLVVRAYWGARKDRGGAVNGRSVNRAVIPPMLYAPLCVLDRSRRPGHPP